MEYLKENDLDETTLVIYTGNHGFSWGEHGLFVRDIFMRSRLKSPYWFDAPIFSKAAKLPNRWFKI